MSGPEFDGFALQHVDVGETVLRVRHGGSGPPVVLLHGHPRTHTTWYAVAPALARTRTVVCPDLRGYGGSTAPPTDPRHAPYSKRAMARDIVTLMDRLGHQRFDLVGHDRGSYVAFRTALDHRERVARLAFLGLVPIGDAVTRCGVTFATLWWHWFFFNVPAVPERVIGGDPEGWYRAAEQRSTMGEANHRDFLAAIRDPDTVHAMLEDYRAGLSIDAEHDDADRRAGRRLDCPTLVLTARREGEAELLYPDLREIWRGWAPEVAFAEIDTGHHMAEEDPDGLAAILDGFLTTGESESP